MRDGADIILRGRALSFDRAPRHAQDLDALRYWPDAGIVVAGGRIVSIGDFDAVAHAGAVDHRPHLLLPGLIDPHVHFPQVQVIASWSEELLDWLRDYTFPAEIAFGDPEHAARLGAVFFDELLRNGTTTAVAFASSSPISVDAYFEAAAMRGMAMLGGKVLMDRGAPEALCDTAQCGHDDSAALIARWHGAGRARYVISPRFAITSTPGQLEAAGALARAHPDCPVQTHMNETVAEIAAVASLFPQARDYLDIYERFGLLRPGALMGHCIHMQPREIGAMREAGAVAVHCPTSNMFLGSGLFDRAGLEAAGLRTAVASDVGGGTSYSMLKTLDAAHKVALLRRDASHPLSLFYWATRGNAEALSMAGEIGTLEAGTAADIVVLDARATPLMECRMETVESLSEELFVLQTLGDDRAVVETYVGGVASKPQAG